MSKANRSAKYSSSFAANYDPFAPLLLTILNTARSLSVSRRTVERLIARGELVTVGQGRLKRVVFESIISYLDREQNGEVV